MELVKNVSEILGKEVPAPNARLLQIVYSRQQDEGAKDFTFLMSTLKPEGGQTEYHIHPVDEMILILSGRGEGIMGEDHCTLEPGTVLYAPTGIRHQCINISAEPMQMACFYVPALPDESVKGIVEGSTEKVSFSR